MANSKIQITISANEKPFRQALQQSFAELKKFSSDTQRIAQQFASLSQFSAKPITPFKIDAASLGSLDKFEQAFRRIQQIKFDDASIAARVRRVGQAFAEQTASVNRARAALAQFQAAQGGATAGASRFASSVAATALGFSAFTVAARVIDGIKNALVGAAQAAAEFESAQSRIQGITESQLATADAFRFTGDEAKRLKADIGTLRSSYADLLLLQSEGILTTREAQAIQEGLVNVQKRGGASNESLRLSMTGLKQILTAVNVTWEDYKQVTENLPALAGPLVRAFGQVTNGAVKNQQDLKNLSAAGQLTSDLFRQALPLALAEFQGAAAGAADTAKSRFQDLLNELKLTAEQIGGPIIGALGALSDGFVGVLQRVRAADVAVKEFFNGKKPSTVFADSLREIIKFQEKIEELGGQKLANQLRPVFDALANGGISAQSGVELARDAVEQFEQLLKKRDNAERVLAEARGDFVTAANQKLGEAEMAEEQKRFEAAKDAAARKLQLEKALSDQTVALRKKIVDIEQDQREREFNAQNAGSSPASRSIAAQAELLRVRQEQAAALKRVAESQDETERKIALAAAQRLQERKGKLSEELQFAEQKRLASREEANSARAIAQAEAQLLAEQTAKEAQAAEAQKKAQEEQVARLEALKQKRQELTETPATVKAEADIKDAEDKLAAIKKQIDDLPTDISLKLTVARVQEVIDLLPGIRNLQKVAAEEGIDIVVNIDDARQKIAQLNQDLINLRHAAQFNIGAGVGTPGVGGGFATGGFVHGRGGIDTILARVTSGEFVVPTWAARIAGADFLEGLRHVRSERDFSGLIAKLQDLPRPRRAIAMPHVPAAPQRLAQGGAVGQTSEAMAVNHITIDGRRVGTVITARDTGKVLVDALNQLGRAR